MRFIAQIIIKIFFILLLLYLLCIYILFLDLFLWHLFFWQLGINQIISPLLNHIAFAHSYNIYIFLQTKGGIS